MSSQPPKYEYPRSITIDTYVRALNMLPCGGHGTRATRRNRVAIVAQVEASAHATAPTTYEAFEAEFLRLMEIAVARQMVEDGV